jgi:general L-amino acid transport system substrate-binding protein
MTVAAVRRFAVSLALALAVSSPTVVSGQQVEPAGPTLQAVRDRGHIICATADPLPGFAQAGPDGLWTGFDVDFCRAVAVAVFNDASRMEFVPLSGDSRFAQLQTGSIDLIARNSPWTMRRDTVYGVRYVATSFFDGQGFMVPQSLGFVSAYELDDVNVCVLNDTEALANVRELFFATQASYNEVIYEDREDLTVAYQQGLCNAVSTSASYLNAIRRELPEPATHRILPERISKDAYGPVVRSGDDQWFDIVSWTLYALINAEESGVTAANIGSLAATKTHRIRRLLGLEGTFGPAIGIDRMFISNVIRAVGNYGEIFDRNFGVATGAAVVRGQNALWINGGLLYAPPVE